MITMGNLSFDPEVAKIVGPGFLNGIAYMFSWGAAANIGAALQGLAGVAGLR